VLHIEMIYRDVWLIFFKPKHLSGLMFPDITIHNPESIIFMIGLKLKNVWLRISIVGWIILDSLILSKRCFKVNKQFKSSSFKQLFYSIYCQTLFKLAWASLALTDLGWRYRQLNPVSHPLENVHLHLSIKNHIPYKNIRGDSGLT